MMSRIAVCSDIHANAPALRAVYRKLVGQVDAFWILGDIFGYGPHPARTWKMVQATIRPAVLLAGNHDWYVLPDDLDQRTGSRLPGPVYRVGPDGKRTRVTGPRESAWVVAQRHRRDSDNDLLATLATLPVQHQPAPNIFLAHAMFSARGNDTASLEQRIAEPGQFEAALADEGIPWENAPINLPVLHIAGHTHLPCLWSQARTGGAWHNHPLPLEPTPLDAAQVYHINPGAVGLPRDRSLACPNVLLLDTDKWTVQLIAVPYNSERVRADMHRLNYPDDLSDPNQFLPCSQHKES